MSNEQVAMSNERKQSKLDELIQELCPDGVPHKALGELGKFFGGLTGKSKDDFTDGNAKFITYKNVYTNPALQIDVEDRVKIADGEKQRTLQYGDVVFTGSSETPDECGISSVVTVKTEEKLYLNSFCFFFRFDDLSIMLPDFAKHLFRSNELRYQIGKTASGVTRYNVSKKLMEKVNIPVPPLPVQSEIVRILDNFTELTARKKQYEFYRDKLLTFGDTNVPLLELRSVVKKSCSGSTPTKGNSEYYTNGTIPWIRTQDVRFNEITEVDSYITEKAVAETAAKWIPENCVIVAISGATAGRCAINKIKATTNQHCLNLEIDETKALYKYIYYCVYSNYDELISRKQGARGDLNSSLVLSLKIPVPPLDVQNRLVNVLDNFDAICSDLKIGLPAEIEARQKQYEFYRDALLTYAATGKTILTDRQTDKYNALIRLCQYVFGVVYVRLGDIAKITDYVANGSFASLRENVTYKNEPDYAALIRTTDYSTNFNPDKMVYINEHAYEFLAKSKLFGGEIIINNIGAGVGTTFRCPFLDTKMSLAPNAVMVKTSNDPFYYYWFKSKWGQDAIQKIIGKSAMPKFNKTGLREIIVPMPTREVQDRIVAVLEKFEALCNDISSGLPAEIEARQKQYEYYRDKLLTFTPAEN